MEVREFERPDDRDKDHQHDEAHGRYEDDAAVLARPGEVGGDQQHRQQRDADNRQQRQDRVGVERDHLRGSYGNPAARRTAGATRDTNSVTGVCQSASNSPGKMPKPMVSTTRGASVATSMRLMSVR